MVKNLHQLDRGVRVILFLILALLGATQLSSSPVLGILLIAVGLVLLATAFMGFCPIYGMFRFSTLKK
ncbi:MAG: DUF2892 domain-containing protein [Anaerolineae bacterium]|nr:DUF2892 domain-containing protein [Anaerolineae bacterium]